MKYFFVLFFYFHALSYYSSSSEVLELDLIISNLPTISPFMYKPDSTNYANWLDRKLPDGRSLLEPINMILVDKYSTTELEAIVKLHNIMEMAGYRSRYGHTGGYLGKMDNKFFPQQPSAKDFAFSDYMWAFTNNHTRIFGPYQKGKYFFWIASVSREKGISHSYSSFLYARNILAGHLVERSGAKNLGLFNLKNKIENNSQSTQDHDGFASIIAY